VFRCPCFGCTLLPLVSGSIRSNRQPIFINKQPNNRSDDDFVVNEADYNLIAVAHFETSEPELFGMV